MASFKENASEKPEPKMGTEITNSPGKNNSPLDDLTNSNQPHTSAFEEKEVLLDNDLWHWQHQKMIYLFNRELGRGRGRDSSPPPQLPYVFSGMEPKHLIIREFEDICSSPDSYLRKKCPPSPSPSPQCPPTPPIPSLCRRDMAKYNCPNSISLQQKFRDYFMGVEFEDI